MVARGTITAIWGSFGVFLAGFWGARTTSSYVGMGSANGFSPLSGVILAAPASRRRPASGRRPPSGRRLPGGDHFSGFKPSFLVQERPIHFLFLTMLCSMCIELLCMNSHSNLAPHHVRETHEKIRIQCLLQCFWIQDIATDIQPQAHT